MDTTISVKRITHKMYLIGGMKVMLDHDITVFSTHIFFLNIQISHTMKRFFLISSPAEVQVDFIIVESVLYGSIWRNMITDGHKKTGVFFANLHTSLNFRTNFGFITI